METLKEKALIAQRATSVKILSDGLLTKKLVIENIPVSKKAIEKIQSAGGSIK